MAGSKFDRYRLDFTREGIKKNRAYRIPTGFGNLDRLIQGGLGAELVVLGAISGLGKSTFALQMAQQIAARKIGDGHIPVLYFSLEIIVLKQRYGMCGSDVFCRFNYYPAYSCFEEDNELPSQNGYKKANAKEKGVVDL